MIIQSEVVDEVKSEFLKLILISRGKHLEKKEDINKVIEILELMMDYQNNKSKY